MPIYGYKCSACDYSKDVLQKISDDPLVQCPNCHKDTFKKQISAPSFRLAGSGWYETDFKTGNKKNLVGDKDPNTNKDAKQTNEKKQNEASSSDQSNKTVSKEGASKPSSSKPKDA